MVRRAHVTCGRQRLQTKAATCGGPMSAGGVEEDELPGPLPWPPDSGVTMAASCDMI